MEVVEISERRWDVASEEVVVKAHVSKGHEIAKFVRQ